MNTAFLLMAQYGARAVIPLAEVVKDYFAPLSRRDKAIVERWERSLAQESSNA